MNSGGEEALQEKLDEQGLNIDKLRKDSGTYYVISEYVSGELSTGVTVSDDEVKKYYDENTGMFKQEETVSARHILLTIEEGAEQVVVDQTKARILALRDRIIAGEDFAQLASETSDCPSSEQGGSLGEFGRGRMVPPFDNVAFSLEPGVISEPVLTQFGYHIIEVTSKNGGGEIPFSDIEPRLREYLSNIALEKKINLYVEGIREKSEIIIF
ncbi:MAG: peptidylprolyl isomerase [Spirochaetales bacterium]|nr:peptidylprolyl isomerase [Spirochaetales bacterium]